MSDAEAPDRPVGAGSHDHHLDVGSDPRVIGRDRGPVVRPGLRRPDGLRDEVARKP
jgi:hypothetical protein